MEILSRQLHYITESDPLIQKMWYLFWNSKLLSVSKRISKFVIYITRHRDVEPFWSEGNFLYSAVCEGRTFFTTFFPSTSCLICKALGLREGPLTLLQHLGQSYFWLYLYLHNIFNDKRSKILCPMPWIFGCYFST